MIFNAVAFLCAFIGSVLHQISLMFSLILNVHGLIEINIVNFFIFCQTLYICEIKN